MLASPVKPHILYMSQLLVYPRSTTSTAGPGPRPATQIYTRWGKTTLDLLVHHSQAARVDAVLLGVYATLGRALLLVLLFLLKALDAVLVKVDVALLDFLFTELALAAAASTAGVLAFCDGGRSRRRGRREGRGGIGIGTYESSRLIRRAGDKPSSNSV